jgi:hypothetical protein
MTDRRYYSIPAHAVAALFGGPLAAIAFATIEAHSLGRLKRDLPWLAAGLIAFLVAARAAAGSGLLDRALEDLGTQRLPTWEHLAYRVAALAMFTGCWLLHRGERRALAAAGVAPVAGYAAGLVAMVIGLVGGTLALLALR